MAYDYILTGSQRFDRQGYLLPTNNNYEYRIFHITAVGSGTGAILDICSLTAGTTATSTTTKYISLALNNSGTNLFSADVDFSTGRLIPGAVLVHTCASFSYAVVDYQVLRK